MNQGTDQTHQESEIITVAHTQLSCMTSLSTQLRMQCATKVAFSAPMHVVVC